MVAIQHHSEAQYAVKTDLNQGVKQVLDQNFGEGDSASSLSGLNCAHM